MIEPRVSADWLSVRGKLDDFKVFGLRNWMDKASLTGTRKIVGGDSWEGRPGVWFWT